MQARTTSPPIAEPPMPQTMTPSTGPFPGSQHGHSIKSRRSLLPAPLELASEVGGGGELTAGVETRDERRDRALPRTRRKSRPVPRRQASLITESTRSRFSSISAWLSAPRLRRTSASVLEGRTLKCHVG